MSRSYESSIRSALLACCAFAAFSLALPASALADDESTTGSTNSGSDKSDIETIVVTGVRFNPNNAPAKASLETTEPQTLINRNYVEDSVSPTADYVNILAIVPSLTGMSINGPGMSDGNVKNTLRGLPDGDFAMTYDGIPFGDTNGPTHHSESYFPSSTIGGIDVDRGPGNAGTLGAATFGGSINLFSEALAADPHSRTALTYGSWNTWNLIETAQSGDLSIDDLGPTRLLGNFQYTGSEGYLTLQNTIHDNELIKFEQDIGSHWTLTFFANRNGLDQHVSDNNGATAYQVTTFGKKYALEGTNPGLPDYFSYNYQHKETDIDYVRLKGDAEGWLIDDQIYTYAYVNKTVTANNIEQYLSGGVVQTPGLGTKVSGITHANDVADYTKLNAYRVWGNILRMSRDFNVWGIPGQLRVGVWTEGQATQRRRVYFDETMCFAVGCDAFKDAINFPDTSNKSANGNKVPLPGVPLGIGYNEHTNWSQVQPFIELELRPIDGLTLTPGLKYVYWDHGIDATSIVKGKPPTFYPGGPASNPDHFITSWTMPFFTANYRIEENWSTYFQYANGIYIPDITAFEFNTPIVSYPKPQTTTNYQFGTVYYADNLTADADIYYIQSDNTINFIKGTGSNGCLSGDECATNIGTVFYKGIEGEATYTFDDSQFAGLFNGLALFGNGSINSAKSGGIQVVQAPYWTAAGGLIYKLHGLKLSLIDKVTGQQYALSSSALSVAASQAFYHLPAYNVLDFTGSYDLGDLLHCGDWEVGGGVYNILNSRQIVSVAGGDAVGGSSVQNIGSRLGSQDQYYFQPQRSYQFTLKVRF